MIFPWLKISELKNLPMTWVLLALNLIFFFAIREHDSRYAFSEDLKVKDQVIITAGRLAQQVYKPYELPFWHQLFAYDIDQENQILGTFALRQDSFFKRVKEARANVDEIEKKELVEFLYKLEAYKKNSQSLGMALQSNALTPWSWITYQFSHSEYFHLFSNMAFLLLFGFLIEAQVGAGVLSLIYILGGIFGGILFLSTQTSAPMIGASASVSAMIAFFIVYNWSRNIPMLYFLGPARGYMGIIYLPAYLLTPILLLDDFIEVATTTEGLSGGVAHSAHVGGILFGIVFAFVLKRLGYLEPLSKTLSQKQTPESK